MPKFLNQQEVYRILQRELPDDVYADGAMTDFFTTADMGAIARLIETAYSNLERVYVNYFPQSADEKIGDWEVTAFGQVSDDSRTLQERRDRVIAKLLNRPGITPLDMERAVTGVLTDIYDGGIEILEWNCGDGTWILDESELGEDTILGGQRVPVSASGPDLCDTPASAMGLTPSELAQMQDDAYTFEVLIFNRTLTSQERAAVDAQLTKSEPARSAHIITDDVFRYVDSKQLKFPGDPLTPGDGPHLDFGTLFRPQPTDRWAISWWGNGTNNDGALFSNCDVNGATNGIEADFDPPSLFVFWGKDLFNWTEWDFDITGLDRTQDHNFLLFYDGAGNLSLWIDGVAMPVSIGGPGGVTSTVYTLPTTFGKLGFSQPYVGYLNDTLIGVGLSRNLTVVDAVKLFNSGTPPDMMVPELDELRSQFQSWYWMGDAYDTKSLIIDHLGSTAASGVEPGADSIEIVAYP